MSQDLIPEPTPGARREARTRSFQAKKVIGRVAVAVIVVTALLIMSDTSRLPGAPNGHRFVTSTTTPSSSSSAVPAQNASLDVTPPRYSPPRSLSYENPMRLWIGGDSLAGSLGPSLGKLEGDTGVVKPAFNSRVSSGLASPNFYNWPKHAAADMALYKPETAVFIIGANDTGVVQPARPDAWQPDYRAKINAMLDILGAGGFRYVIWVGAPRLKNASMDRGAQLINEVAKEEVGKRKNAEFVDSFALFSDASGNYVASLPIGPSGRSVRVRTADGVHFTPDGGDYLASHVARVIDDMWVSISRQSVPGKRYPTIPVKGSTRVAGTSRDSSASVVAPTSATSITSSTAGATSSTPSSSTSSSSKVPVTATSSSQGSGTSVPSSSSSAPVSSATSTAAPPGSGATSSSTSAASIP